MRVSRGPGPAFLAISADMAFLAAAVALVSPITFFAVASPVARFPAVVAGAFVPAVARSWTGPSTGGLYRNAPAFYPLVVKPVNRSICMTRFIVFNADCVPADIKITNSPNVLEHSFQTAKLHASRYIVHCHFAPARHCPYY